MNPMRLGTVREVVEGVAIRALPDDVEVTAVSTDTRAMTAGSLFIALRGETHDGHAYLPQAAAAGAAAALVEAVPAPAEAPGDLPLIRVRDTRRAMGALARHVRRQMSVRVVAVGGSNGKTGTKRLIDSALRRRFRGTCSPRSFNNDVGVPLAIFPADPGQDYLVLELGTNHHGEIRALTNIALPDVAVITNVSAEHLEGLGDLEGVRREEATLIEGLAPQGLLVVNGDDEGLLRHVARWRGRRVTFGWRPDNDLVPADVRCGLDGVRFRVSGRDGSGVEAFVPLLGVHVAVNALAAFAVAREMGLDDVATADALRVASGPDMRLQLQRAARGITLLNDAYNANPASVKAALETLASLPAGGASGGGPGGRRVAVLGDMRELGAASEALHREVGRAAAAKPLDLLICVGPQAALIAEEASASAALRGPGRTPVLHFPDTTTARLAIGRHVRDGDLVLLKGSRSMKLEQLAEALAAGGAEAAEAR